ncbi:hypothetical protein [Ornithinibacillus californiensis]|uniref:hypothetical protein n=1 Tax=Ornithinibacillus californiensis TaxID=161536 RepID=UPI00064D7423|nr:hypothetical protein [Ornithinibacillus californiensis]
MKSKFTLVTFLLLIALFSLSSCSNETKSIEQELLDEMADTKLNIDEFLHLEIVENGVVTFYSYEDQLYSGFIKKDGAGWEWHFGGGAMPLQQSDDDFDWHGTNFDDFIVQYGIIWDPTIKQMMFEDNNRKAKIIENEDGLRIYFFINEPVGPGYYKVEPVYE